MAAVTVPDGDRRRVSLTTEMIRWRPWWPSRRRGAGRL